MGTADASRLVRVFLGRQTTAMPTSWKDFGRSGARNTHVTADLLDVGKGKGDVMNQTYWFEGLFGQTRCRIGVTRKSDTWIAEAFAVALSGEIAAMLNANGSVRTFAGSSETSATQAARAALETVFGPLGGTITPVKEQQ